MVRSITTHSAIVHEVFLVAAIVTSMKVNRPNVTPLLGEVIFYTNVPHDHI